MTGPASSCHRVPSTQAGYCVRSMAVRSVVFVLPGCCSVMPHESFEYREVAALMTELFVNVKVDREERPDLDQIYQTSHALLTRRSGGWPLTMFLTPDGEPFFGGTYYPKLPRYGSPG